MPDFLYTSPRTNRSYRLVPDDPNYVPTELDKQEYAAYIEQQETASAQPAPAQPTAEAPDSGQSIGGARLSSAIQGITTIPGTIAQGVGATFLSPFGITALEESGKYAAEKARELTPIDPKYRGNLSVELFGAGGQAVGQLASALATGGGTIGTNVALAQAAAMGAASGAESAERRGLTGINRLNEVLGYGASEVITERMFGLGSKSFFKPAAGLQAKAVKAGTTILGEGVEESAAGALTNIVSNLTAVGTNIPSPDILSVDALKSYARQGLSGLVGGTVFAGAQMAMGEQATSQPTTTVTGRDPNTGATVDISDLTEQQIEDRGYTDVRTSVIPDSSLTAEIIESPNERVANILTEVGLNSATPVENQAFIDSLNQSGIPVDPAIVAAPAAPAAPAAEAPAPTVTPAEIPAPAAPTAAAAPIPVAPTTAEAPIPTVEVTPTETGVAPAVQPPITPPAVEPTPTPAPDATQIGQVTESDLSKYPDRNEVGPTAETGDRDRIVQGREGQPPVAEGQAVTPLLPSEATPTEPGTLPTTPMTGVSGEVAPPAAQAPTAAAPTAAAPTAAAPTAAAAQAPTAAASTAAVPTAAAPTTATAVPTTAAAAATAAAAPTAAAPTETVEEPEAPARQQNSDIFGQDDPNVDPNAQVDDYLAETPTESLAEDLAQFFGISDRPKEVQSFNELINNFIKPFVFDSSLPISESQTLKAQEILDSLSPGSDMNSFKQRMIAMDPRLGSMDAVPGAVLGELYNYALKLNDNGAFYQSMRDLGSKLPYSYGSSGESAGRGLGIISFYVRKSPRFKALNQHENSANKKAATKGVATAEQLAAISRASNDGASETTLESNLSATDANGTNVISTLTALSVNAPPVEQPVEETRRPVAASDLATGAKAAENVDTEGFKQRQIASKKAKSKAKKDKGIPPNLEEDGDKAYSLAETPLGQTKGKVTKADVFSAAARLFNLRPTNIVVIDTEVPNARGKQYAGEVDLSTKVITINLRNVKDVEHLDRVLQEEVDHLVFQDPAVQADVKLLTENVPADLVQDMQDQGYEDSVQKEEAVIRYARNLASNAQTKSLWQNLLESIKSAFRRIFNSPPTQYELTRAAQRFVARSAEGYPTQGSGTGQRSSLTPEDLRIDQEYLAAVEAGDMETAQRLVKEAATKAGYNVGPVYHGTPMGGFTAFDKKYQGQTGGISRGGFSFTTNKEAARTYAEANTEESVTLSEALRIANTSLTEVEDQEALEAFFIEKGYDGIPEYSWEAIEDPQEFANFLLDFSKELPPSAASAFKEAANLIFNGYGFKPEVKEVFLKIGKNPLTFTATPKTLGKVVFGLDVRKTETKSAVVNLGGGEQIFYVAEPNQIKSADPVTYDDAGNIIPPSKRFQKTSDDIRYSVVPEEGDMEEGDAEETELGEDAYTQETAEKEATPATPKKNVKAKVKVPKTEAEANLEATKNYIAAADRNVVNGGKPAKVKNAAAKLLSEASNLQKRKIKYGLTQAAQDNFLANLTQDLVNLGVPQQTAYEAARRAWAKYATKKRNSDDNAALAAARRAQKEAADKNKVPLTAQEEAQKKATETANAYTSRFDKSQTETLTAEQVQDPVAVALKNAEKVPRISAAFDMSPQAKNAFLTGLNSQLIRLGVEPTAAWAASNRAWLKYQTTRTARAMKLRSDIAKYGFARVLAKELASIPVHLQRNPDYMKSVMRKILIAGGITETVADATIPLLMPQFTKAVADAREVAVRKFIDGNAILKKKAKEKPTEFDKLIKAVRLGATDPTYTPSVPFAKENKWQRFTTEDHEKMIALDEEINDESLPPLIRAQKALELAQLADKRMNDPKALKILTEYIVNNTLSGIGTAAIQAFTPIYSMGVRVTTDGVRGLLNGDTNRFFASLYSLFDAADAVLTELSYAFKTDSFRYGQQAELAKASQLRRILNDNIEIFKNPKSGEQKVIAAAKIAMAAPDFVRRLYSSMDTASQSLFLRQVQNIGGYDILKKSGMTLKEFKGMLDAKRQVRDALIAKLTAEGQYTRSQIRLIAEDAAMMEYGNLIIDAVGETGAQDVTDLLKTAPLEAKSEIGVSDLKENPEGHVIPAMIQFLEGLTESVNAHVPESAQGAGDLAFRLLIGYPKTALQMLNRSLYYSPVGFYRAYLNRRYERDVREGKIDPEVVKRKYSMLNTQSQKEQRYAEAIVGSAAMVILFGLLLAERDKEEEDKLLKVHNLGPANRAEKQIWRAAGNVEQSIQWRPTKNSPWISVSWAKAGLESLAPVLMTVGTLYDVTSDSKSAQSTALDKSMLIAGGVLGGMNRPLSGLQDLGQILTGEKNSISSRSLASFAGFRASGLIPFSSLLKTSNKLAGPRDLSNAKSSLLAQIPIAGPSLTEPGLNLFGDSLGSTPNELTYKLPIFPVQIGMQTKDVPFYENILSKGQFPPVKLRSNFEKSYGPVTDSTWRQFVQIRGQYLKSQITTRWDNLDKLNPKKYNDIIDDIAQSADDKAVKQLKLKPVKK